VASAELETLLAVQDHDTVIDQLRHRRESLPERAKRASLIVDRAALAAERDQIAAERDGIAEREAALERELGTSEERIAQIDKRMYSGEVSAARDLQAMGSEIDRLKEYCSGLEDQALALLDEREPLDAAIESLEGRIAAIDAQLTEIDAAINAQEQVIDADLGTEERTRRELAASVNGALLERYEALRKKLGGIGAAYLNGHSCGGCHLELPATEIDRIKREPADALILCDQSGRILVRRS
jgi:predicted  nucleic acid-binding Zn-ribbon protein